MKRNYSIVFLVLLFMAPFQVKNAFAAINWLSTSPLPSAYLGVSYSVQLQATVTLPNVSPVTYTIPPVAGSLPPGLSLSTTGLISGTVIAPGASSFTVTASATNSVSGATETNARLFTISSFVSAVTGPLRIKRLQVRFDNNRPEITVAKDQPPPRVYADLSYIGSGILRGYWSVDGAIHSRIEQNLISGQELVLSMPPVPPLPTYQSGGHRVTLVITEPPLAAVPEAIYYVTEKERKAFAPIGIIGPPDRAELDYTPLNFRWQLQSGSTFYLVEFFEVEDEEPIFSAYTKGTSYALPNHSLRKFFSANNTYLWRVQAFSAAGEMINESNLHQFTFR
jgi:hypothetical protein